MEVNSMAISSKSLSNHFMRSTVSMEGYFLRRACNLMRLLLGLVDLVVWGLGLRFCMYSFSEEECWVWEMARSFFISSTCFLISLCFIILSFSSNFLCWNWLRCSCSSYYLANVASYYFRNSFECFST